MQYRAHSRVSRIMRPFALLAAVTCLLAAPAVAQAVIDSRGAGSPIIVATLRQGGRLVPAMERTIALDLREVPLEEALAQIARQAGLRLVYSSDLLPAGRRVTLHERSVTAAAAFAAVLRGTNLEVLGSRDGHAVIVPADPPPPPEVGTITGHVTARGTGEGIPGAAVVVEGTALGGVTGPSGWFRIARVPAGAYTLSAHSIGYHKGSNNVTVEADHSVVSDFALDAKVVTLDQIVVTGTVTPTPVRAIPTPIAVVTASQIDRQNLSSVDEIFRTMVPGGVQSTESPGPGGYVSYSVRGTSSLGSASTLKVYVDGIEVQDPAYVKNIDPSTIERVEVLSGPEASAVYGSGAISGVMQIFLKHGLTGATHTTLSGKAALGTIDSRYVPGSRPVREDFALNATGGGSGLGYNFGGSWVQEGSWEPHSRQQAGNLFAGGHLDQGPVSVDATLRYRGDFSHTGLNPRGFIYHDTSTMPPTRRGDTRWSTYGVRIGYAATSHWQHTLTLGYDGNSSMNYTIAPRHTTPRDTLNSLYGGDWSRTSLNYNTGYRATLSPRASLNLTAGGDYSSVTQIGFSNSTTKTTEGSFGSGTSAYRTLGHVTGLFAQGQLGLNESLYITAGLHGDRSPGEAGTALSPRLGVSWVHAFDPYTLKLRGSYGSALVAPPPSEKEYAESSYNIGIGNPDLQPERQRGFDGGADLYLGNWLALGATYYDQMAIDLINLTYLTPAPDGRSRYQYQNVGRIHNRGAEFSATVTPQSALVLTAVYGSSRSTVEDLGSNYKGDLQLGDRMPDVPDYTAGATVSWTPIAGTTLTGNVARRGAWTEVSFAKFYDAIYSGKYTGKRRDYWIRYPAYTKVNFGVSKEVTRNLTGYVQVDNVGNSYAFERIDLIAPQGRIMMAGVKFRTD